MPRLTDKVAGLFKSKRRAMSELSPYTVEHEKLDEFILGDMREHSTRFNATLANPVEIEADDGSTEVYEQAMNLRSDLWFAHHVQSDDVRMADRSKVKASDQLNSEIMRAFVNHEDFLKIRPHTRSDEIAATLATMAADATLTEELKTTLKTQAEQASQVGQDEDAVSSIESMLEELRAKVREARANGDPVDPQLVEDIKNLIEERKAHQQAIDEYVAAGGAGGISQHIATAVAAAQKEAKELTDTYVSLPGVGIGAGQRIAPEAAIELAYKWRNAANLKKMAELIGRFERDFRYKRSHRVVGGSDEIVGVEVGNDVQRLLPMEAAKLRHPVLRRQFYKDFANRQLLQYEMIGYAESGKGPIVIAIDASGSMSGERNEWARAVALAVSSVAIREKRPVYIIEFSTVVTGEWELTPKGGIDPEVATDFAMSFNGGGTDITKALERAEQVLAKHPDFRTADVLLITDGSDYLADDDLEIRQRLTTRGVRMQGVVIGMDSTPYTDAMCDDSVPVYDLAAPSGATDRIVQGLT